MEGKQKLEADDLRTETSHTTMSEQTGQCQGTDCLREEIICGEQEKSGKQGTLGFEKWNICPEADEP